MRGKRFEKFKAFVKALDELANKLFNHHSAQHVASFSIKLKVDFLKPGERLFFNKKELRDILSHGLNPDYPNTPFEKRGDNEDSYRKILRSEAEKSTQRAISEVVEEMAFKGGSIRRLEQIAEKNMVGLCLAYGKCRALKEPNGHLHSMMIDFQGYFLGEYSSFGFKSLNNHNPVMHETNCSAFD